MATPASSSSSAGNKMKQIRGGDETAAEGLLLLPPQIQDLYISNSPELSLRANSLDDDTVGGTGGGGLQGLHSLRSLMIQRCPYSISSFPTSLQDLCLKSVEGMATLAPLSNLTSLTKLVIWNCGDLRGEDLWPLLTQLVVFGTPKFFIGSEPSRPHEQELLCHSSKLQYLQTDDVAGVLAAPVCGILSSSLISLKFDLLGNFEVERFTEEQEKALHLLTSLQDLEFVNFGKLQCLPAGLHRLTNLNKLQIICCSAIRSLAKDGLPSSLRVLDVYFLQQRGANKAVPQVNRNHSNNHILTNPRALLQFVHSPSLFSLMYILSVSQFRAVSPILYIKLILLKFLLSVELSFPSLRTGLLFSENTQENCMLSH